MAVDSYDFGAKAASRFLIRSELKKLFPESFNAIHTDCSKFSSCDHVLTDYTQAAASPHGCFFIHSIYIIWKQN
jgi:hypothetical protein